MRITIAALPVLLCCLMATGCSRQEAYDLQIYYLNSEETALATEGYSLTSETVEGRIEETLNRMQKPEDSVECISAIPTNVMITDIRVEDDRLDLYLSEEYGTLESTSAILLQASIVQTVTQIEGVDCVQFHVADDVLKDHDGRAAGYLYAEDFIQDDGEILGSFQKTENEMKEH